MRFAKTFFAALAVTLAAAGAAKSVVPAEASTTAVCNPNTGQCAEVIWSDGSSTI